MSVFTREGHGEPYALGPARARLHRGLVRDHHPRAHGDGRLAALRITSPKRRIESAVCELWAFVFDPERGPVFAGVMRHPADRLAGPDGRDDGAVVRIGNAWLSETHLEGEVATVRGVASWSLDLRPADACLQHVPQPLRRRAERKYSVVCAPNLGVPFFGSVKVDDELYEFDGDLGQQGHRWGRAHAPSWAWAHCSSFDDGSDSVFEAVGARTMVGPVPAPTTHFIYLRHAGEEMAFNDMRSALRARGRYEMPTWAFTAYTDYWRIPGASRAGIDRMVQVAYTDPDGSRRYCVNSEVADLGIEIYHRSGSSWLHHASLTSLRGAHLEFGRRDSFVELPVALQ